jgi:hypothetical protein
VFNLQQGYQFDASNDDIQVSLCAASQPAVSPQLLHRHPTPSFLVCLQYFDSITCDGITFGVWAFCNGTFTNEAQLSMPLAALRAEPVAQTADGRAHCKYLC